MSGWIGSGIVAEILGCDEIVPFNSFPAISIGADSAEIVLGTSIPADFVVPDEQPTFSIDQAPPAIDLEVSDSPVVISQPFPDEAFIVAAGPPGPQGIPGSSVQEIYVQSTLPAQGAIPWLLAQLDAPGGTVQFLKVYEP